ncbi:hypothetical protein ACLKA7_007470 [Drosophila subpalustris]
MIATLFIIFAFIRAFPWSRRRAYGAPPGRPPLALTLMPATGPTRVDDEEQHLQLHQHNNNGPRQSITTIIGNGHGYDESLPRARRKSSKFHEVTFSGSVGGGESDGDGEGERDAEGCRLVVVAATTQQQRHSLSATSTTSNSGSMISAPYRTLGSNSHSSRSRGSRDFNVNNEYYQLHASSSSNGGRGTLTQRSDTMATEAEEFEDEERPPLDDDEDESYDRETEEFYSNIQDATNTSSSHSRSKRSSLFSRSDSSATTTSSSGGGGGGGTFTGGKRRSAASIMSSSLCSDVMIGSSADRRNSTATEYSVRSLTGSVPPNSQRRSSGRVRRYVSRMTIAGARRRTTGR